MRLALPVPVVAILGTECPAGLPHRHVALQAGGSSAYTRRCRHRLAGVCAVRDDSLQRGSAKHESCNITNHSWLLITLEIQKLSIIPLR